MMSTNDLLAGASVYVGIVGILFGVWYPQIGELIAKPRAVHFGDAPKIRREAFSVFLTKALPLLVLIGGYLLTMSEVLAELWRDYRLVGSSVWKEGNQVDVGASLLALTILVISMFFVALLGSIRSLLWRCLFPVNTRKKRGKK